LPIVLLNHLSKIFSAQATTTLQQKSGEYWLLVAPDSDGSAVGELYLDDGDSINVDNKHTKIVFEVSEGHTISLDLSIRISRDASLENSP